MAEELRPLKPGDTLWFQVGMALGDPDEPGLIAQGFLVEIDQSGRVALPLGDQPLPVQGVTPDVVEDRLRARYERRMAADPEEYSRIQATTFACRRVPDPERFDLLGEAVFGVPVEPLDRRPLAAGEKIAVRYLKLPNNDGHQTAITTVDVIDEQGRLSNLLDEPIAVAGVRLATLQAIIHDRLDLDGNVEGVAGVAVRRVAADPEYDSTGVPRSGSSREEESATTNEDLNAQAWRLFFGGDQAGAEKIFRKVLASQSDHLAACNGLGFCLINRGEHQEALPLFQKCVEANPKAPGPLNGLGRAYEAAGKLDKALDAWRRSADAMPGQVGAAHLALARVYSQRGDWEAALPYLELAVKASPDPQVAGWLQQAKNAIGADAP